MELFKIKLKTKNGNDINQKQNFKIRVLFHNRKNVFTGQCCRYIFSFSQNDTDFFTSSVKTLKHATGGDSTKQEDNLLRILCNTLTVLSRYLRENSINADSVLFNVNDLHVSQYSPLLSYKIDWIRKNVGEVDQEALNKAALDFKTTPYVLKALDKVLRDYQNITISTFLDEREKSKKVIERLSRALLVDVLDNMEI